MDLPELYDKIISLPDPKLRPSKYITGKIRDFTGQIVDAKPWNFQVQGVLLMTLIKRFVLGDETGLGKTLQMLYSMAYIYEKHPDMKFLWIGPKTTLREKMDDFQIMLSGMKVRETFSGFAPHDRKKSYGLFQALNEQILVTSWPVLRKDWKMVIHALAYNSENKRTPYAMFLDEATAVKSTEAQTHKFTNFLAERADRVVAASATCIKNRLDEMWSIFKVVNPSIFGSNRTVFENTFCMYSMQKIRGRGFKVPQLAGYKNLSLFREKMHGSFVGRTVEQAGVDLPKIAFKTVPIELSADEKEAYSRCLSGTLQKQIDSGKKINKLSIVQYSLQLALSRAIMPEFRDSGLSSKEEYIVEALQTDLQDEKTIIYSYSRVWVERFEEILRKKYGIKTLSITGAKGDDEREQAKKKFNQTDDHNVIFITDAGGEGINLQAARVFLFATLPYSYGTFKQLIGRYRRIGSKYKSLLCLFLTAMGTADVRVKKILNKKKELFGNILNDSLDTIESDPRDINDLFQEILSDVGVNLDANICV